MILGWLVAAVLCLIAGVIAYRKWMGNIREMRRRMGVVKTFLWFVGAALCLVLGFFAQKKGTEYIREMRQMERVPKVSANHVITGEVSMEGSAREYKTLLRARYSKSPCLYYRYLKEREEKDSDGDTRWVTVERGARSSNFFLSDKTGEVLLKLTRGGVFPDLNKDYTHRVGKYRFSEWRIDPNEKIYAFAMANTKASPHYLSFDISGSYRPILSNDGAMDNRSSWGTKGVMFNALGISLFCFGCLFFCFLFRIHRVLVFLSLVSVLVFGVLVFASLAMMKFDLTDGYDRLVRIDKSSVEEINKIVNGNFDGDWSSIPGMISSLDVKSKDRALGIRDDYFASISRTNQILERFPENLLAPIWGMKDWELPSGMSGEHEEIIENTPISRTVVLFSMILAVILISVGVFFGFRRIKIKRFVENIPTSASSGLCYGPAEIKGTVEFTDDPPLTGPETKVRCAYYRHKITEKRGSGKNSRTVVIKDETNEIPFLCQDKEGRTKISPEGAEVTVGLKFIKRRGARTYYEWHLPEKTEVYILGSAVIDQVEGDELMVSNGNDQFPFLISDETETEVMLRQGRKGLLGLGIAQNATVFLGLVLFGAVGSFAATDFLLAAMFAPLFLTLSMFALMYNDLIFLRNRVSRAWANIEVSLKKRSDLIPNLEQVVKNYLSHERGIMIAVTQLRSALVGKTKFTPEEADVAMRNELTISNEIFALKEAYPDLKSNQMLEDFMNRLARMENEVSMMRSGYNDGIERYRTVKQRFPEVIIARTFGFKDHKPLTFSSVIRQVPKIELTTSEGSPFVDEKESSSQVLKQTLGSKVSTEKMEDADEIVQLSGIYLNKEGQQYGPYDLNQVEGFLRDEKITVEDLACWDGKSWKRILEIPGLNLPESED